ncbi:HpcH/HpaI aldolase family protein [Planctomicrobium sp. SH668]|uniref:HpcH/HpaI aldolase family protein n=1 Tax=Planctomicrobium sp. SH668 TaxID=3448126 RepID=UPI003F5C6229
MHHQDDRSRSIKSRLARKERLNVFALGRSFHPNMVEMFGLQGGFDGFWIDHEHGGFTIDQIESAARAGRAWNLDSFVRVAPTDYATVTRALESGVGGVMAAQVFSPEQAEQFVRWSKFAPRGERGLNGGGHDGQFGLLSIPEFCQQANQNSLVAIQIETAAAVECCEEIASISDVDHLFLGPADLSQAYGIAGDIMHPRMVAAVVKIAKSCERHGKTFGAVTFSPEHSAMLVDHGCSLVSMTTDVKTFQEGIKAIKEKFKPLF